MKFFIANFKAQMTHIDVEKWLNDFTAIYTPQQNSIFIICPSYVFIPFVHEKLKTLTNVYGGSQDISPFDKGSYTGEVSAFMLKEFVSYTIIGHSERRKNLKETDEILQLKVQQAQKHGIEPIFCVRDENDTIPQGVRFVAYEPVTSIGTGQNGHLKNILDMKNKLQLPQKHIFIYGGSVTADNVNEYTNTSDIQGFLIGKASLQGGSFLAISKSE